VDDDKFGQLLDALPRIAEAVNQFQSPTVQEHAFLALVRALGIAESPVDASCQSALSGLPAIDFSLPGLQSLLDFAGEKNPKNKYEQNLLAVYYLEHILGLQDITTDHVRAAYKECNGGNRPRYCTPSRTRPVRSLGSSHGTCMTSAPPLPARPRSSKKCPIHHTQQVDS